MHFAGKSASGRGPLLLLSQLEVLSFEENLLLATTTKRLRINGRYRLKVPGAGPGEGIPCLVSACELQIVRSPDGSQVPLYKVAIELLDGGSEAQVTETIRACLGAAN